MNKQAFLQGFIEKCSEYNFTIKETQYLLKMAKSKNTVFKPIKEEFTSEEMKEVNSIPKNKSFKKKPKPLPLKKKKVKLIPDPNIKNPFFKYKTPAKKDLDKIKGLKKPFGK